MKRPLTLWVLISIFLVILAIWLWQDSAYPHTIYEYIQTDKFVTQYEDRVGGFAVDAVAVWEADNPLWIDVLRRAAPVSLFIMPWFILAIELNYRDKKEARLK